MCIVKSFFESLCYGDQSVSTIKQKMVIKVTMNGPKKQSKAMKIIASKPGVISATLEGDDKGQFAVVAEGVDSVALIRCLRKKMGYAELVSVAPVDEKKKEPEKEVQHIVFQPSVPYYMYEEVRQPGCESCSIM